MFRHGHLGIPVLEGSGVCWGDAAGQQRVPRGRSLFPLFPPGALTEARWGAVGFGFQMPGPNWCEGPGELPWQDCPRCPVPCPLAFGRG